MKTERKALLTGALASAIAALVLLLSSTAFGADSAKEATPGATSGSLGTSSDSVASNESPKVAASTAANPLDQTLQLKAPKTGSVTGGLDPHGDSWQSIQNSLQQFAHPAFVLRLFLSLALAVACTWLIAWHPRASRGVVSPSDLEERKALIILGVAGAIVAELGGLAPTLAFVIFGIGALLRFRTVLDSSKATGKAILVVVIGLACGMGSWMMAIFVTAFSWVLIYWLDSHRTCSMTIRLDGDGDSKPLQNSVQSLLFAHRCRVQSCTLSKGKKRLEFLFQLPAGLDPDAIEAEVKAKLPKTGDPRVTIKMV